MDGVVKYVRDHVVNGAMASIVLYEKRQNRRDGMIEGLKVCLDLETPEDFETVITMRHGVEAEMRKELREIERYWRFRCATVQIEFVYERLRVVWRVPGPCSVRAVAHVASILRQRSTDAC